MSEENARNIRFTNALGSEVLVPLEKGKPLFILGANGVGKSALMHRIYTQFHPHAKRLSANRQTWFTSNALEYTPANKVRTEQDIVNRDHDATSRWTETYQDARSQIVIFNLIYAENERARRIAAAVDADDMALAQSIKKTESPLKSLNSLLRLSNLPIAISIQENERLFASKRGSVAYSIAELSDGERNAILIAADILTSKAGTVFVIDEPERHLHRSIISPLLLSLFQKRDDCLFVIATHDLSLALDNPESSSLLVRSCTWKSNAVFSWDADLVSSSDDIDYKIKEDILGPQRTLLFVEGTSSSLDKHIYSILFPEVTVISQGNCSDVEKAVKGIRSTSSLNWARAFGLVDADNRTAADIDDLKKSGIHALPCYSVEAIYYDPAVIEAVAQRQSAVAGDADAMISAATDAIVNAMLPHKDRLCARVCERRVQEDMQYPDWKAIQSGGVFSTSIDLQKIHNDERLQFDGFTSNKDIKSLIQRYPIREAAVPNVIACSLNFPNRGLYEAAVRKLIIDDETMREFIRSMFGDMVAAMSETNEAAALEKVA